MGEVLHALHLLESDFIFHASRQPGRRRDRSFFFFCSSPQKCFLLWARGFQGGVCKAVLSLNTRSLLLCANRRNRLKLWSNKMRTALRVSLRLEGMIRSSQWDICNSVGKALYRNGKLQPSASYRKETVVRPQSRTCAEETTRSRWFGCTLSGELLTLLAVP